MEKESNYNKDLPAYQNPLPEPTPSGQPEPVGQPLSPEQLEKEISKSFGR